MIDFNMEQQCFPSLFSWNWLRPAVKPWCPATHRPLRCHAWQEGEVSVSWGEKTAHRSSRNSRGHCAASASCQTPCLSVAWGANRRQRQCLCPWPPAAVVQWMKCERPHPSLLCFLQRTSKTQRLISPSASEPQSVSPLRTTVRARSVRWSQGRELLSAGA